MRLEHLEERAVLAPVPIVSLSGLVGARIGESVSFQVDFDNQATGAPTTGFGPYVDLFVDTTGADGVAPGGVEPTDYDGLSAVSATYLGASLTVTPVTLAAGGTFTHPFARTSTGVPLTGTAPAGFVAGDTMYVITLPFGSFVDTQPVAPISVNATVSPEADLGAGLRVAAVGGFAYGADALDNPTLDAPLRGATASSTITPSVLTLTKTYSGPENETATGPNYPRRYTIRADVASGQTVTDLRLIDVLPDNIAFLSLVSSTPAGAIIEQTPTVGAAANAPNNDLVVRFPSVTGGAGASDAAITIEYFVPRLDANSNAVISPTTGDDVTSLNDGRASGNWIPVDPSDAATPLTVIDQSSGQDNHTLTDKSLAIQKSVSIANDTGVAGPTPGDTLQYTLSFQVSDYFSFGDLQIEDVISDGQRLVGSPSGPFTGPFTLSVTDRNGTVAGNFTPSLVLGATNLLVDVSQIGNDANPATDGSTRLVFDVSRAMTELGAADGVLQGGRAVSPDDGAATGTITFQTVIQQLFSDTYPSGRPTVDQGDLLGNTATISGSVRDNADLGSVLGVEDDGTTAEAEIVTGGLLKTIYAVNGVPGANDSTFDPDTGLIRGPSYASNTRLRPGDTITYRLRYYLPTGDVETFTITDYLPLPVFDASSFSTTFDTTISATSPAAGTAKYGPDHTFSRIPVSAPPTRNPLLTVDPSGNSVMFDFGTYDDPPPEDPLVVDLLLSATITNAPMADGLFLTNQVSATHGTTNAGSVTDDVIAQIVLAQPVLGVRKGIVSTDNASRTFSGTVAPPGITFEAPGLATPASSFSGGTVHSTNLGTTLNANLGNVDAGDLVKFAIVVENRGTSNAGAFDVRLRDTLPAGLIIPATATGLNLEAFDGTGAPIAFTPLGTGLFDAAGGIELLDPGPTPATVAGSPPELINGGAIDGYHALSGRNLAIITFDLQVANNVQPGQTTSLLNTATVFNYAGQEDGADHTNPTDLTDTAQITIATPIQTKSVDVTSETHTGSAGATTLLAIGEIVRYRLVTQLPEGQSTNLQFRDNLPAGLQFLNDGTAQLAFVSSAAGGVTSSNAALAGASAIGNGLFNPTFVVPVSAISGGPFGSGTDPIFSFGNLTNSQRDSDPEYVILEFNALTLNSVAASNDAGDPLDNTYSVLISGSQSGATSAAALARVVEPSITNLVKSSPTTSADAGDSVNYTVTFSNANGANVSRAFETQLLDTLPADLTLNVGSINVTLAGGASGITNATAGNTIDLTIGEIPAGGSVTVTYTAGVGAGISPAEVLTNTAAITYTSLPGPNGTTSNLTGSATPGAGGTDTGERTGSGTNANDHWDTDPHSVTGRNPIVAKSRVGTSINDANNGAAQAVIGEIVTYDLTLRIPEGFTPAARVTDTLPAGLAFVDLTSVTTSGALTVQRPPGTGTAPTNVTISSNGQSILFDLGDITNSDRDNGFDESIVIRYRAVVLNTAGNQQVPATSLTNSARMTWTGGNLAPVAAGAVTVIEPALDTIKSASAASVDAADLLTFTLTITHTAASGTDAYDVVLSDPIPAGLNYVAGSLAHTAGTAPSSLAFAVGTITATWPTLSRGGSSTLQFQATISGSVQAGQTLTNTATGTWTSLPGTTATDLSIYNTNSRERTGSGGVNDYVDTGSASVSVNVVPTKSLVAHSEAATPGSSVTVGEIVRYHLTALLPEGSAPDFQLVDSLPAGLQYQDDGTARFAFVSNGPGITSSTLGGGYVQTGASGALTPTFALPAGVLSGGPFTDGTDPVFRFGNLTNSDNDVDAEYVVVEFNALVLNVAGNVAGVTRDNSFLIRVAGAQVGLASNVIQTSVVEPAITDVAKSALPPATSAVDAGQVVTFSVSYSNPSGATVATAFDARLTDALPSGLNGVSNVRVFRNGGQIATGFVNNSTASTLDVTVQQVAPGDRIEIRYDATVTAVVLPGAAINNLAQLTYSSLPGAAGTVPNSTGSIAGAAGTSSGERNGSGGVNTYMDSDGETLTVQSHSIAGAVYRDDNNNGVFDEGATAALAGVTVTLTGVDHLGNAVNQTLATNAAGAYLFNGLRPGNYTVTESQPAGMLNGRDTLGTPVQGASNADRYDDRLGTFTIAVGSPRVDSVGHNFGELQAARVAGFAYLDADNNGLRGAETGLGGVTITLTGTDDLGAAVNLSSATAADGSFSFGNLRPGTYTVTSAQPAGYLDGYETRGNVTPLPGSVDGPNTIGGIVVGSGQTAGNNNFGDVPPANVSGRVFVDHNNSGTLSGNDAGLGGVTVTLSGTDVNGTAVSRSTVTAADGSFSFASLWAGTYTVVEPTQPSGYFDGQEARGGVLLAGSIGSDTIGNIVVGIGATSGNHTFAEVPSVDPTGYVYVDSNDNGTRDAGEMGIPGVTITLSAIGLDVFGNPVAPRTTVTDASGYYQFANLPPARYTLTETQPAGFFDGREQNGTPPAAVVNNDQFVDIDLTSIAVGGDYNFGELSPSGSLSGSAYVDANNNGRRDAGEIGLAGVRVTIVNQNDPTMTATVVTDAQGNYRFVKMFPGTYRVTAQQPINFLDGRDTAGSVSGTVGNDTISNIVLGSSQAATGYLFGELGVDPSRISKRQFLTSQNPGSDFTGPPGSGLAAVGVPLADPSGYVYVDTDGNGRRSANEPGIAGVRIDLSGVTTGGRSVQGTAYTDGNGFYQFANLSPGTYAVYETQPAGYWDGLESLGSHGGIIGNDQFTAIVLHAGDMGVDYDFGERLPDLSKGDVNGDGRVEAADIDAFYAAVAAGNRYYDLTGNGRTDRDDVDRFIRQVLRAAAGDVNLDGQFDSADLILVFAAGQYEDSLPQNSRWTTGDWNLDGEFTSDDLVWAFRESSYGSSAKRLHAAAIDEVLAEE